MEKGVDFHPGGDIHPLCLYGLGQPVKEDVGNFKLGKYGSSLSGISLASETI